ncbi:MAG: peptidylprolyl isomerase [Burkholderiaceae bacterium]|nr:peptidylprolyl isomerase [Roseateles sp.]MBV8468964.1 peptidylprolyl isomerase [Burkholderiaceae bacterium]
MTDSLTRFLTLLCGLMMALGSAQAQVIDNQIQPGDHIAAVVNQDVVAASEISQRVERMRDDARRKGDMAPDMDALRKQALDALVEDRVIVTYARDSGTKVDEPELDRVVTNVAAQNKLTMEQLRERLKIEGLDFRQFRENLRDQLLMERVREREVLGRINITDGEIDKYLDERQAQANKNPQLNLAQVLVTVPQGASEAQVAERRAIAEKALKRVQGGEDFAEVAKELSEDGNRQKGGEVGLRAADKLPDLFVDAVRDLKPGEVLSHVVRSEVGFHVIKLLAREGGGSANSVVQTHARHVLLRPSAQLSTEVAARRLLEFKRNIESGRTTFEKVAKDNSEDGSAAEGGDLGWASPGGFVPEFEEAMNALPVGGISGPVLSRFGVHLIQVIERRTVEVEAKALREQARNALRERKYEQSYLDWVKDLRAKAFVELREWQ